MGSCAESSQNRENSAQNPHIILMACSLAIASWHKPSLMFFAVKSLYPAVHPIFLLVFVDIHPPNFLGNIYTCIHLYPQLVSGSPITLKKGSSAGIIIQFLYI